MFDLSRISRIRALGILDKAFMAALSTTTVNRERCSETNKNVNCD